jgi:glycerophosphoryl diester phosphodiesterase
MRGRPLCGAPDFLSCVLRSVVPAVCRLRCTGAALCTNPPTRVYQIALRIDPCRARMNVRGMHPSRPLRLVAIVLWALFLTQSGACARAAAPAPGLMRIGPSTRPEIIGHRGAAGLAPENTLAAFARACAVGVDGIELDVHLSSDDQLVVHHDYALHPDLTRDSSGSYSIADPRPLLLDLPWHVIRQYDVGRLRPGSEYAKRHPEQRADDGARIPTLDEVITLFERECAPPTRLVVEIKTDPTQPAISAPPERLVQRTLSVLRARGVAHRAQIIAFDWRVVMQVHREAPEMPTSVLTGEGRTERDWNTVQIGQAGASPWMGGLDVDEVGGSIPRAIIKAGGRNWSPNAGSVTPARIEEAHRLGVRVFPWTVNDTTEMKRLLDLGADGITTDRPDLLRALLERRHH